ncbi:hypothetical protein NEOLI_001046 [Neolecta irregularis DAH-3]|uniref:Restriction endonuclease type IV Mrr domain-containing protein n=1 Tax=Neolecta irregularis (strain DAH-3) TaxID=1198029 RepID=A0A1U7LP01_NEOID|nr:hypothetical protein NEOLI_001046 [Neolecta irregularis DAH-3]|eukprot:OLL24251.1 hypothetical protein NEOLI_001046 [Neolecta irregularis DAH-3]
MLLLQSRTFAFRQFLTKTSLAFTTSTFRAAKKASDQHHDLESYLKYIESSCSSTTSTVYNGTVFEYTAKEALGRIDLKLHRSGGRGDKGVDLRGQWHLKINGRTTMVPTIVQCKTRTKRSGPRDIRELEGALANETEHTIGILASTSTFTDAARQQLLSTTRPMCYCLIGRYLEGGALYQLAWNGSADRFLAEYEVKTKHKKEGQIDGEYKMLSDVSLVRKSTRKKD